LYILSPFSSVPARSAKRFPMSSASSSSPVCFTSDLSTSSTSSYSVSDGVKSDSSFSGILHEVSTGSLDQETSSHTTSVLRSLAGLKEDALLVEGRFAGAAGFSTAGVDAAGAGAAGLVRSRNITTPTNWRGIVFDLMRGIVSEICEYDQGWC